jgi:hypothetical protein
MQKESFKGNAQIDCYVYDIQVSGSQVQPIYCDPQLLTQCRGAHEKRVYNCPEFVRAQLWA